MQRFFSEFPQFVKFNYKAAVINPAQILAEELTKILK